MINMTNNHVILAMNEISFFSLCNPVTRISFQSILVLYTHRIDMGMWRVVRIFITKLLLNR